MRIYLKGLATMCTAILCAAYGYHAYMGDSVNALAAFIPWMLLLANDIRDYNETT